jgi:hypothetical protein
MFDRKTILYGLIFAAVLFVAGWVTGIGLMMSLINSLILGACAAVSLAFIKKYGKPKE